MLVALKVAAVMVPEALREPAAMAPTVLMEPAVRLPLTRAVPATSSRAAGAAVPIPTLSPEATKRFGEELTVRELVKFPINDVS